MNFLQKQLFLFLTCCFATTYLAAKPPISPSKEKPSLLSLHSKVKVPSVSVTSIPKGHLLFSSYIKEDLEQLDKNSEPLDWSVTLTPSILSILETNDAAVELCVTLLPALEKHFYESISEENTNLAILQKSLKEKTFQEDQGDVLSPKNACAEKIQTSLKSSLEFKVLSKRDVDAFIPELGKEKKETTNIKAIRAKLTLSPVIKGYNKADDSFIPRELVKNRIQTESCIQAEEKGSIETNEILFPDIVASNSLLHLYDPTIENEVEVQTLSIDREKVSIQKVVHTINEHLSTAFAMTDVSIKSKRPFIQYKENTGELTLSTTLPKIVKHPFLDKLDGEDVSLTVKDTLALKKGPEPTTKHVFFNDLLIQNTPTKPFSHELLAINNRLRGAKYQKGSEPFTILGKKGIIFPNISIAYNRKHQFSTSHYKSIAVKELFAKDHSISKLQRATFTDHEVGELSNEMTLEGFSLHKVEIAHHVEAPRIPDKEACSVSYDLEYKDPTAVNALEVAHVDSLSEIEEVFDIEYREVKIGRLPRSFEESVDEFFIGKLPDFLDAPVTKTFSIATVYKYPFLNAFSVDRIDASMDTVEVKKEITSELVPKRTDLSHHFEANFSQVGYSKELSFERVIYTNDQSFEPGDLRFSISYQSLPKIYSIFPSKTSMSGEELTFEKYNLCLEDYIPNSSTTLPTNVHVPKEVRQEVVTRFEVDGAPSLFGGLSEAEISQMKNVASRVNKDIRLSGYSLYNWPTLEELNTDSLPSDFYLDTKVLATEDGDFDFACTLKINEQHIIDPLPSHILYVIDASSSMEPHRFNMFKQAVIQSLSYLDPSVKFNIAILNQGEVEYLLTKSARSTKASQSYVKRKLRKISQSKRTRLSDMITLLEKEKMRAKNEIGHRSCVLLSDGNFAKNIRLDREYLQKLSKINTGNFSVYTATVSDKNNREMLSLLAKLNHGFSLFTKTHASFARKFSIMVKYIKSPIMHDIVVTFPDDPDDTMAYVTDCLSPTVLANKSITFFGNTKDKKSSRVFIQGKSGDRWVNILKELPLDTSRNGRYKLAKKLAGQKTLFSLYSFLESSDEKYLSDAKKHLDEFDILSPLP